MTIDDIPERLRQPGLIINNGQEVHVRLSEQVCDNLAFMAYLDVMGNEKEEQSHDN